MGYKQTWVKIMCMCEKTCIVYMRACVSVYAYSACSFTLCVALHSVFLCLVRVCVCARACMNAHECAYMYALLRTTNLKHILYGQSKFSYKDKIILLPDILITDDIMFW